MLLHHDKRSYEEAAVKAQKADPDRQLELETLAGEVAGLVRAA